MPGVGVKHQPCAADVAGQDAVIGDRVKLVVGAVGDQRGRRDPGCPAPGSVHAGAPVSHGQVLNPFRAGRHGASGRVSGDRGLERVEGAGLISGKVAAGLDGRQGWHHGLPVAGVGRAQHQPADLAGMQDGQRLGDHAAHRPAQDIRPA